MTRVFTAAIFLVALDWKQLNCLSTMEWIHENVFMINYSTAVKIIELQSHEYERLSQHNDEQKKSDRYSRKSVGEFHRHRVLKTGRS